MFSQETWDFFGHCADLTGSAIGTTTILGLPIAIIGRERIFHWVRAKLRRNAFPAPGITAPDLAKRTKGLVFTVSRAEVPIWVIEQFKPGFVGLVVTTESRKNAATEIQAHCEKASIKIRISREVDKDNIEDTRGEVDQLIGWMISEHKLTPFEIATDVTGGSVPMSLGAFMAAEERQVASIYVTSQFDPALKSISPGSQRTLIVSSPKDILGTAKA